MGLCAKAGGTECVGETVELRNAAGSASVRAVVLILLLWGWHRARRAKGRGGLGKSDPSGASRESPGCTCTIGFAEAHKLVDDSYQYGLQPEKLFSAGPGGASGTRRKRRAICSAVSLSLTWGRKVRSRKNWRNLPSLAAATER